MLTKDQKKYFFNLFKNSFYLDDKVTIEALYKDIEKPEVREKRDKLLIEAEKNAIKFAKKAVSKIKNLDFKELFEGFTSSDESHGEQFGENLLKDIEKELRKK